MRITGGVLRGRRLRVPAAGMRPTADRVREALFSVLGDAVVGARVLDLYAGTGAWGLEAWSRGASAATWVERDRRVFRVLTENVERLCAGGGAVRCVCADVARYLARGRGGEQQFDLVLADPPYDRDGAQAGRVATVLRALREGSMMTARGQFVMEQGVEEAVEEPRGWTVQWERAYGDTRMLIYRPGTSGAAEPPA